MKKVITYGTYDFLHYGHIRLLERAKALGDYLIVGVTSDDFDKQRGKINVQQSLMERVKAVKETGLADEIIIEEYEGQKIDDICNYGIDIFAIGSDWVGKFDYLKEYCEVVYLERTKGVSSTEIRTKNSFLKIGAIGNIYLIEKHLEEANYVNGLEISYIYSDDVGDKKIDKKYNTILLDNYKDLINQVDAIYVCSHPNKHYEIIKEALKNKKHVLYESPLSLKKNQCDELIELAEKNNLILMEAIKTAYSTAYSRLLLLVKSGRIGDIISIDATCTSLKQLESIGAEFLINYQNSICAWGPTAMLPIFQLLGIDYESKKIYSLFLDAEKKFDLFSKIDFKYKNAVASIKIGKGIKSEGNLIIAGTKGYIYVPAPWWKTDYFEIRYENIEENKRYFYQLNGEGIRYELVAFLKSIQYGHLNEHIDKKISKAIVSLIEDFNNKKDLEEIER